MSRATAAPFAVTVDTALRMMSFGRFRVPGFHRPFVWARKQTSSFFESIVAGLPTGAITIVEDAAEAAGVEIGPLHVLAPADPLALWIVDGMQRLGALAGTLLGDPRTAPPAFLLAYDLESDRIRPREYGDELPPNVLPLHVLADPVSFSKWLSEQGAVPHPRSRPGERVLDDDVAEGIWG